MRWLRFVRHSGISVQQPLNCAAYMFYTSFGPDYYGFSCCCLECAVSHYTSCRPPVTCMTLLIPRCRWSCARAFRWAQSFGTASRSVFQQTADWILACNLGLHLHQVDHHANRELYWHVLTSRESSLNYQKCCAGDMHVSAVRFFVAARSTFMFLFMFFL